MIYRGVQLIPRLGQSVAVSITHIIVDVSQVECCQLNSRRHLSPARARQLYIPEQLKPIKTAAAGNWSANRETECDAESQETFFFPPFTCQDQTSPDVSSRLSRQAKPR